MNWSETSWNSGTKMEDTERNIIAQEHYSPDFHSDEVQENLASVSNDDTDFNIELSALSSPVALSNIPRP